MITQQESQMLAAALPHLRETIFLALKERLFGGDAGIAQCNTQLKSALKKHKAEEALSKVLLDAFAELAEQECNHYARLIYMKEVQVALMKQCREQDQVFTPLQDEEDGFTELLEAQLLYLQFNHPAFIRYYKQKMADQEVGLYSLPERYDLMSAYQKTLKSQEERRGARYCENSEGAKTVLLSGIKATLKYLRRKLPPGNARVSEAREQPAYRIRTVLSVDGLAYLIRLLIEAGAITASPRRELLQFICQSVETPRTAAGPIGFESFLSKYKQPVQSTAVSTRALLKKMLKITEEGFGGG